MPRRMLVLLGAVVALGVVACSSTERTSRDPITAPALVVTESAGFPACPCTIHNPEVQLSLSETKSGVILDFAPNCEDPEVALNLTLWLRKAVPRMIPRAASPTSPSDDLATLGHRIIDGGGDTGGGDPIHPHGMLRLNEYPAALIRAEKTINGSRLVIDAADPLHYDELLLGVRVSMACMVGEPCIY